MNPHPYMLPMIKDTRANSFRWLVPVLIAMSLFVFAFANTPAAAAPMQENENVTASADPTVPIERATPVEVKPKGISLLRLLTRGGWFMVPLLLCRSLLPPSVLKGFWHCGVRKSSRPSWSGSFRC